MQKPVLTSPAPILLLLTILFLCALPLSLPAQESTSETTTEAVAPAELTDSGGNALVEKLRGSGKTGVALFLVSVIGFSFAFERLFHLRKPLV
ncbi:MAG TPA: hypothetical protein VJ952_09385, partial [Opitutales bacterium]|nr:hypothetical protein [Opitutales bacterium]